MDTGRRTGGGKRGCSPQLALVGVKARLVPSQVAVSRMDASKAAQRLLPAGSSRSGCVTSRCVPAAHGRDGVKRQVASPSARDVVPSTRRPCPSSTAISASPTELMGTFTLARARRGEVGWCAPEVLRLAALAALDPHDEAGRARCIAQLRAAFELSVEQGARFWSLRIAISLFEVAAAGSAERASARGMLLTILNAIDDGSAQPDLQRARYLAARENHGQSQKLPRQEKTG
jgi:hypothetical protein